VFASNAFAMQEIRAPVPLVARLLSTHRILGGKILASFAVGTRRKCEVWWRRVFRKWRTAVKNGKSRTES